MHTLPWMGRQEGFEYINHLGAVSKSFCFLISYDKSKIYASSLEKCSNKLHFCIDTASSYNSTTTAIKKVSVGYLEYLEKFNIVTEHIKAGDTYLLNLTQPTTIYTTLSLKEIYQYAKAKYRVMVEDMFVSFSPETFIEIDNGIISTHPMKGTIDASLPNAKEIILNNQKEFAEHTMIVDLMRNDLNMVAGGTRVEDFRYIDKIHAGDKELLQVSSKITASLPQNWRSRLGDILDTITPAGSITGTPKRKSIEIIKSVEGYERGFYTGIFGICKENQVISTVLIRYIEQTSRGFVYKSGGGITIDSNPKTEYKELIDKIYIPH